MSMFFNKKEGYEEKISKLSHAAYEGKTEQIAKLLKSEPLLVNARDQEGKSALHHAVSNNQIKSIHLLLSCGADVNVLDNRGWTVLHVAAYNRNDELTMLLLNQHGVRVDIPNEDNTTPLHYLARSPYTPQNGLIIETLIKKGANVNCQNNSGEAALHSACWKGQQKTVEILIANNANVNLINSFGETPLHWACRMGRIFTIDIEIVKMLLEAGADKEVEGMDGKPLDCADTTLKQQLIEIFASTHAKPLKPSPQSKRSPSGRSHRASISSTVPITQPSPIIPIRKGSAPVPVAKATMSELTPSYSTPVVQQEHTSKPTVPKRWVNVTAEVPVNNSYTEKPQAPKRSDASEQPSNRLSLSADHKDISKNEVTNMELNLFEKMATVFGLLDAHSMDSTLDHSPKIEPKAVKKPTSSKENPWWAKIRAIYKQETPTLNLVRVDDPTPISSSPSTSIPETEGSDLSRSARAKLMITREILETEESYCQDLDTFTDVYAKELCNYKLITEKEYISIFANIHNLRELNHELLKDLKSDTKIGESFLRVAKFMDSYAIYCSNYKYALETAHVIMKTPEIAKVLNNCKEQPQCRKLDIFSYLIKPLQRICKYPLLLGELMKYTPKDDPDYEGLFEAFEALKEAVDSVNEKKRATDEADTLLANWNRQQEYAKNISGRVTMSKTNALALLADVKLYNKKPLPKPPPNKKE